jgi:hypothetical protein
MYIVNNYLSTQSDLSHKVNKNPAFAQDFLLWRKPSCPYSSVISPDQKPAFCNHGYKHDTCYHQPLTVKAVIKLIYSQKAKQYNTHKITRAYIPHSRSLYVKHGILGFQDQRKKRRKTVGKAERFKPSRFAFRRPGWSVCKGRWWLRSRRHREPG